MKGIDGFALARKGGESGQDGREDASAAVAENNSHGTENPSGFTQEDIERIISQRYAKWQSELEDKLAQARDEGRAESEKVAKMSYEQKLAHEREEAENKSRKREDMLSRREADIQRRELRQQTGDIMASKGLPARLLDVIDYSSAEARDRSVDLVEAAFRQSVQLGVEERLKSVILPQRPGKAADYDAMTDEMYYATVYKNKE